MYFIIKKMKCQFSDIFLINGGEHLPVCKRYIGRQMRLTIGKRKKYFKKYPGKIRKTRIYKTEADKSLQEAVGFPYNSGAVVSAGEAS